MKKKSVISDKFLIGNGLRNFKIFFKNSILQPITKVIIIAVLAVVLLLSAIKIFAPKYSEKIGRKANYYFFHYLNLDSQAFGEINISGNYRVKEQEILEVVSMVQQEIPYEEGKNYEPLINVLMKRVKLQLPWVNQVVITRTMPDILNISIVEYEPFAIWENGDEKYLTDKDGNLLPYEDSEEFKDMIILSGQNAYMNARSLFNIFASDPEFSENVYSATWISDRRWDIRLENGVMVKLPEKDISDAWQSLIKIYNMSGSMIGLQIIDLRIHDKVYLEYNEPVIKELKNL